MKLVPPLPPEEPVESWSNMPDHVPFGREQMQAVIDEYQLAMERSTSDIGRAQSRRWQPPPTKCLGWSDLFKP